LIISESQQARKSGLDGVGDVAPRFRLGKKSLRQRRRSGAEGIYFDAGILRFEGRGNLFVLLGGERRIPDNFAFPFRAVEQQALAIRAAVSR
jgi:hypothetical protein